MMPARKSEIPFVVFLIPFLSGIWFGISFNTAFGTLLLPIFVGALSSALILLNLLYKKLSLYKSRWLGGALIHLFLFFSGWVMACNANEMNLNDHFSKKNSDHFLVRINSEPKISNGMLRFTATVQQTIKGNRASNASGNLLLTLKSTTDSTLFYGDRLLIPTACTLVDPPANPAEFNYKNYLANQNIHYRQMLYARQYLRIAKNAGNPLISYSLSLRQKLVEKLKENIHSPEAMGVASTILLGYKASLDEDTYQAYSKTGTVHVLSVSGAQVGIIFILLEFVFSFLNRVSYGRFLKAGMIIFFILYYALLTGFSPTVCRAALMISFIVAGKTFSKTISTLNILALSAFLLLTYNPLYLNDVGFQLSYLAVGSLITLQPYVYKWFKFKNKWLSKLWLLCSVSLTAQVVTFPLTAWYFHQFPVYFLISNLLVIIPAALIMYCGIAYFLFGWLPIIGKILGCVLEKTVIDMDCVLHFIEHAPLASINNIWLRAIDIFLLFLFMFAAFYGFFSKEKWPLKLSMAAFLLFSISVSLNKYSNLRSKEITLFYIRKHQTIAFRSGNQAIILTDLCDSDRSFKYAVQPYLDSCQVVQFKLIAPDSDISQSFIIKKKNLINFDHKTLMIYNKTLFLANIRNKIPVDYLLLSAGRLNELGKIERDFDYQKLIVCNNWIYAGLAKFHYQNKQAHRKYVLSTGNKSLLLLSNQENKGHEIFAP